MGFFEISVRFFAIKIFYMPCIIQKKNSGAKKLSDFIGKLKHSN